MGLDMGIPMFIPFVEPFRSSSLSLLTFVVDRRGSEPRIFEVVKLLEEFIWAEPIKRLGTAFESVLRNEVAMALSSKDLVKEFPVLVERFWYRLLTQLAGLSFIVQNRLSIERGLLDKVVNMEKTLAKVFTEMLRVSEYGYSENLVYAMSVLIDRDIWILKKTAELDFENLVKKLIERDLKLVIEFTNYTAYLTFAWISAISAVLHIVEEYRRENLDTLTSWSKTCAEEIESYLDTMDILLDDETYEEILRLEAVER